MTSRCFAETKNKNDINIITFLLICIDNFKNQYYTAYSRWLAIKKKEGRENNEKDKNEKSIISNACFSYGIINECNYICSR